MKKLYIIFTFQCLLLSTPLSAHPGHEHAAAGAGLIHLLWLVPFIVAAVVLIFKEISAVKTDVEKISRRR